MAKGKHAVTSANRRYEAAIEHIDRLTTEVVDAKARARQYQRDAERVPGLVAQIESLHEQINRGESDKLAAVKAQALADVAAAVAERDAIVSAFAATIDANRSKMVMPTEIVTGVLKGTPWTFAIRKAMHGLEHANRGQRRDMATAKKVKGVDSQHRVQDNRRLDVENMNRALMRHSALDKAT